MKYLLLHGLGQGPDSWSGTVAGLKQELRGDILCPDLARWCGAGPVSFDGLYEEFSRYCAGLPGPLGLCGLSLGGVLALEYAARNPERVGALALIGVPDRMPRGLLRVQDIIFRLLPARAFRGAGLEKPQMRQLCRSMAALDPSQNLEKLRCPVLVACGARDRANRAAARRMASQIPGADLLLIPGAGHEVNRDAPAALAEALEGLFWE